MAESKNQEAVIGSVFKNRLNETPEKNQHGHVRTLQFLRQNSSPNPSPSPTPLRTKKRTDDAKYPDSSPDTVNFAQEEKLKQKNAEMERERLEKEVLIKQLQETNAQQIEANQGLQAELENLKLEVENSDKANQLLQQQVKQQREDIATETAQNQKQLDEKKQAFCALKTDYDRVVQANSELEREWKKLEQKNAEMERERLEKEATIERLQKTNDRQIEVNKVLQAELEALKLKVEDSDKKNQTLQRQVTQQGEEIATKTAQEEKQLDENESLKRQLDEEKQEVQVLKVERDQVVEENKTLKARIEVLTRNDATIAVKTRQDLILSIAGELVTGTEIQQANLTATEVLEVLSKLGSPPNGQTLTGTLLTAKKAQAVLVVRNSIQNFTLKDLLEFKVLIDAKKQEDTTRSDYSFIRQEQGFFRCRYGNTQTWETIMGLVKSKLSERLAEAQPDQLDDKQKSKANAIFQTHRKHGYGFGFFSTPKIPPGVEAKLAVTTPSVSIN